MKEGGEGSWKEIHRLRTKHIIKINTISCPISPIGQVQSLIGQVIMFIIIYFVLNNNSNIIIKI